MEPNYRFYTHETTFAFVDTLSDSHVLNERLLFWVELFKIFDKKPCQLLLVKDFIAKRSLKVTPCSKSSVVDIDFSSFEIVERDVSGIQEHEFDMRKHIDEKELASQAVDLNVKLMRWRHLDHLDMDKLHNVKVLLIGAGTLGCQLARNLMGWGIKNITFADYGKVSPSNPVRQSLYNFEDFVAGKFKAECAAEALRRIHPTVNSRGVRLNIHMPGHQIRDDEIDQAMADVDMLDELIREHDAIYLLLDTREARWLPSVISAAYNKWCFSVALGFDNFIVIRHGGCPIDYDPKKMGIRPGCYFCNDYLSPSNTMKDRSLDMQCTVTRPGLSYISTAYASELLVNMLHLFPEDYSRETRDSLLNSDEFGLVPQHVRGSASGFNVELMTSESYDHCLACGSLIVSEYMKDRKNLVLRACNSPNYLQEASGISKDLEVAEGSNQDIICFDDEFS